MKSNFFKYIFTLVVIVLIVIAVYTIYKDRQNVEVQPQNQIEQPTLKTINEIRLGIANFDTMNPILSTNKTVQDISRLAFEPLINITPDYDIEPCLAKEFSKLSDNSYLIKLREDVKWHNGETLTASDVEFTINMLKDINIPSIYKSNLNNLTSVEIIDQYTIRLNLDYEIPFFEYNLTFPIICKSYYENEDFLTTPKNSLPVGTGKYKIQILEDGNYLLKRNQNYWNQQKLIQLENIYVNLYSSMGEIYNAFKLGYIDLINTSSLDYEQYIGTIGFNKKEYKGREYDFIAFNTTNNILANREVRRAIAFALNREDLINTVYNGQYYVSDFPLDNGSLYYQDDIKWEYNQEEAKRELIEAGWNFENYAWRKRVGYNTLRLELNLVVNSSNEKRCILADKIKDALAEVGIRINVNKVNDYTYNQYINSTNYDMIICGTYSALSPDLTTYLGQNNLANYQNEEILSLLNEINNITNVELLKEKYKRIIEIYKTEVPYIGLSFNKNTVLYNSNLIGEISPNWYNIFYDIENWYIQIEN